MTGILAFYFGWYQGAVYSNLLASRICALLVLWRAKVHIRRSHEAVRRQLAEQHASITAHITAAIGANPGSDS